METSNPTTINWGGSKKELTTTAALCLVLGIPLLPVTFFGTFAAFPLGLLLLVVDVYAIWRGYKSLKKLSEMKQQGVETFEDYLQQAAFVETTAFGRLKVDESNRKFLVQYLGDIVIHDFSEIQEVEIRQNGDVFQADGGIFRDGSGKAFSDIISTVVNAAPEAAPQAITSLSVTVRLNHPTCPVERISYISSGKVSTASPKYLALHENVQNAANLLLATMNV